MRTALRQPPQKPLERNLKETELGGRAMNPTCTPMVALLRDYLRLYQLRNLGHGRLEPRLENEWKELSFTVDSVFSGLYRAGGRERSWSPKLDLRKELPLDSLRVPLETGVICDAGRGVFGATLRDLSTGGAYVQSTIPFPESGKVRLIFCTDPDDPPIEVEGRVAWTNPAGQRKRNLPEGSGVQFLRFTDDSRLRIRDFVYRVVEQTLASANLI